MQKRKKQGPGCLLNHVKTSWIQQKDGNWYEHILRSSKMIPQETIHGTERRIKKRKTFESDWHSNRCMLETDIITCLCD